MKRLKLIGCLVALFAVVCMNMWNAATSFQGSELNIEDVENVAEAEHGWLYRLFHRENGTAWVLADCEYEDGEINYEQYKCCKVGYDVTCALGGIRVVYGAKYPIL